MIGELDAIGCHSHPNANPVTGVAHACGHHAQMAAMIGCAIAMADPDVQKCLAGTVNFLAAVSYTHLDVYKRQEWYDIFRPELDCVCRYRPLQPLILTDFRTYLCRLCR